MAITLDIYTVGGLPYISQALKGIVLIIGDSTYHTILRVTILWGLTLATIIALSRKNIFPMSYLAFSFFLFHGFYSAKVDVNVIDTKLGQNYVVTDVPFGVALTSSMFSAVGHTLSNLIDTAFHTGTVIVYGGSNSYVSDLDYERMGYLGAIDYFAKTKQISVDELVETARRWDAYNQQCFIPYVATLDETQISNLLKEKDLFNSGKLKVPIKLLMSYDGTNWYCDEFYENMLKPKIESFVSTVSSDPTLIGFNGVTELSSHFLTAVNALTNASYSVQSLIAQSATLNALKKAVVAYSSESDEFNREVLASHLIGESEGKFKFVGKTFGEFARKVVPLFAIVLQFLIIVSSATIAFMILLPAETTKVFWNYVRLSAWVHFWYPALATFDAIMKVGAIYSIHSTLSLAGVNGLTINSIGKVLSDADMISAIGGYLALIGVPGLAWMLLKGSDYVAASIGQMVGSRLGQNISVEEGIKASTAEKVGYDLTGTVGEGFTVRSALFANPTSLAHGYGSYMAGLDTGVLQGSFYKGITDATMGAGAGTATYNAHGGSIDGLMRTGALTQGVRAFQTSGGIITQRVGLDGSVATQTFNKTFEGNLFSGQLSNAYRQVLSEKKSEAYQELQTLTSENAYSEQAGKKEFIGFENSVLNAFRDGKEYVESLGTSTQETLREMQQIRDGLQKSLGVSEDEATRITDILTAKLEGDLNFRNAFKKFSEGKMSLSNFLNLIKPVIGDQINVTKDKVAALQKTAGAMAEFSQSRGYEKAISALREITQNDSIANQIVSQYAGKEGVSVDLTRARSYIEKVASAYHKIHNYEKQEQMLSEKGGSFSVELSQAFINWYAKKEKMPVERAHEFLNNLAVNQPLELEAQFSEFAKQYADKYKIDPALVNKVTEAFKTEKIPTPQEFFKQERTEIENLRQKAGVDNKTSIELRNSYYDTEKEFTKTFETNQKTIHKGAESINTGNLRNFKDLKEAVTVHAPDGAQLINRDRASLLWDELKKEKAILYGGAGTLGASIATNLLEDKNVKDAFKEAVKFIKNHPVAGTLASAALAEGAIIVYENQKYVNDELQKIATAEKEGKVKTISSLDDLGNGEVGIIQKGNYTFEVIKEPHRWGTSADELVASAYQGADIHTYTIIAQGSEGKPMVFVMGREDADRLINEGITPGWLKIGSFEVGEGELPGYEKN